MRHRVKAIVTGAVLAAAIFLTTLPVQLAEAHVPTLATNTTWTQVVQLHDEPRDLNIAPSSASQDRGGPADDVAWLAVIVIALPILAVLISTLRTQRPTRRPGRTY